MFIPFHYLIESSNYLWHMMLTFQPQRMITVHSRQYHMQFLFGKPFGNILALLHRNGTAELFFGSTPLRHLTSDSLSNHLNDITCSFFGRLFRQFLALLHRNGIATFFFCSTPRRHFSVAFTIEVMDYHVRYASSRVATLFMRPSIHYLGTGWPKM